MIEETDRLLPQEGRCSVGGAQGVTELAGEALCAGDLLEADDHMLEVVLGHRFEDRQVQGRRPAGGRGETGVRAIRVDQDTAGRIGSLARLIRQAAIEAILDGQERITKALLDSITLDHLAEEHYRPRTPTRRTRPGSR